MCIRDSGVVVHILPLPGIGSGTDLPPDLVQFPQEFLVGCLLYTSADPSAPPGGGYLYIYPTGGLIPMAIRIVTDSSSDFDPAVAKRRNVEIVSMPIQFGKATRCV